MKILVNANAIKRLLLYALNLKFGIMIHANANVLIKSSVHLIGL